LPLRQRRTTSRSSLFLSLVRKCAVATTHVRLSYNGHSLSMNST
jgi:hypothetical protein